MEARSVLEGQRTRIESRPGYRGARAIEFIPVDDERLVVGVYWIGDDGARREPLIFQLVTVRDGRIALIQDYRKKMKALRRRRR